MARMKRPTVSSGSSTSCVHDVCGVCGDDNLHLETAFEHVGGTAEGGVEAPRSGPREGCRSPQPMEALEEAKEAGFHSAVPANKAQQNKEEEFTVI